MGALDDIAEKASQKIADHVTQKGGGPKRPLVLQPPQDNPGAPLADKITQGPTQPWYEAERDALSKGSKPAGSLPNQVDVVPRPQPQEGVAGAAGMDAQGPAGPQPLQKGVAGMAGREPAGRTNNASDAAAPVVPAPPVTPATPAAPASPLPVIGNKEVSAGGAALAAKDSQKPQYNLPGDGVGHDSSDTGADPVKSASEQPDFWGQLLKVASDTGRSIIMLMGDMAAGYSGNLDKAPDIIRIQNEQALRMQGDLAQHQKDIVSMTQGFQKQQDELQRSLTEKLAGTTDSRERDIAKQNVAVQREQIQNSFNIAKKQLEYAQILRRMDPRYNVMTDESLAGQYGG